MPVQMIELEEVVMSTIGDDVLTTMGSVKNHVTGVATNSCLCVTACPCGPNEQYRLAQICFL